MGRVRLSRNRSRLLRDDQLSHPFLLGDALMALGAFDTQEYTLYRMFITYKVAELDLIPKYEGIRITQVAIVRSRVTYCRVS